MIAAIIALSITTLANAGVACFIFLMGHRERAALLDRIQAPEASRLMQVTQALDAVPSAEEAADLVGASIQWDDDLRMILSEEDE